MAAITNAAEYPYFLAIEPAANELMPTNRSKNALRTPITEPRSLRVCLAVLFVWR
jgi:hypothetical protein